MGYLDFAKQTLILPPGAPIHDPSGVIAPYEGGLLLWGLLEYGDTTDDLVKSALDELVKIQLADGSWYEQYYPTRMIDGTYDQTGTPNRVDSGAALASIAMSRYDAKHSSITYKTVVQKAMSFLRACQVEHNAVYGKNLLANLIDGVYPAGTWVDYAFAADCAEALMSMKIALDTYGDTLLTSGGYSVKTMANALYEDFDEFWTGGLSGELDDNPYQTAYPAQPTFPTAISFTQGLVARAIYEWVHSGYNTGSNYEPFCKRALNYAIALITGKWGGFWYHPSGQGGTVSYGGTEEVFAYTALMALGMHVVDSTTYADRILKHKAWMDSLTNDDGSVYNEQRINGVLIPGTLGVSRFITLNTAYMLLVKAHQM
jgi:hypothetical protein